MEHVLQAIAEIVPTLEPADQQRVLDVALSLRDARRLPDITLPPDGADEAAWSAWNDRVDARSTIVLEREKQRLVALGLIDEHWNILTDEVPPDMLPSSQTSVET